ncbi:DUF3095 family protein [Pseudoxanthobacter sp.]|uniref:DUF3095 family protein n=1 Tax=Pseudoxanthobacter sp. TaxID=1925742 RepID=UPI002FE2E62B
MPQPFQPPPAAAATGAFYRSVPVFDQFSHLTDPALYRRLPDDWLIGLTDVVASTALAAEGRYKAVNAAGAAAIAALANAIGSDEFPFAFGGDGAAFAVGPEAAAAAAGALSATAAWVAADLDMTLRAALVPVSAVRAAGLDIAISRFAPSPNVTYAMFAGGGLTWSEARMKAGLYHLPAAPAGARPDLSGLSCHFDRMPARRGIMLSLVVVPAPGADPAAFRRIVDAVLAMVAASGDEAGSPVPEAGPPVLAPLQLAAGGLDYRTLYTPPPYLPGPLGRLWFVARLFVSRQIFRWRTPVGAFDPKRYLAELVANTDFRKFDDGLRMTLDCTPAFADRLEARLAAAADVAVSGLHRQDAALMTCIVPSVMQAGHMHFVDGAEGGYAAAMRHVKTPAG